MMVYGIYIYCIYNIIKRKYVHAVKLNQHSHHVWPKKWVKTRRSLRRRPARRARRREEVLVIEAMVPSTIWGWVKTYDISYTLWQFNIAIENGPLIVDFPIKNCHFP